MSGELPSRLPVQGWLSDPDAQAVIAALEARGGAGCARFVGGCVRNTLMGEPVADLDIATWLEPPAVVEALAAAGLRSVPTGLEHGTVTAVCGGRGFEITTLRRDVTTDGRRATVAFTGDWVEDAERRDFRFNAIYAAPDGTLFDPTGQGVADALARRVVFVGEPHRRIREDYLRILRYFRFLAWYGQGEADEGALAACAELRDGVEDLAAERVSAELLKLLAAPDPRPALRLMDRTGVLAKAVPAATGLTRLENLVALETDPLVGMDVGLRLAALGPEDADEARAMAQALRLPNALRERLAAAAGEVDPGMGRPAARAAIYRLGARAFADRATLAWADSGEGSGAGRWRDLLALAAGWTAPVFPLGGADAVAAGAQPGRAMGEALRQVEAWWVEADFPGREAALDRLRAALAPGG